MTPSPPTSTSTPTPTPTSTVSRRTVLAGGAAVAFGLAAAGGRPSPAAAVTKPAAVRPIVPLPSPAEVRRDFQTMVDFGPRLPGNESLEQFTRWLEDEFVAAGATLRPCDQYAYNQWTCRSFGLDILEGSDAGPVDVSTYFVRSASTGPDGITGNLVYAGVPPVPDITGLTDLAALTAALESYPDQLTSWLDGLLGTLLGAGDLDGSILLVDLPLPLPLTAAIFAPLITYLHWPGHNVAELAEIPYDRSWIVPGVGLPLAPFEALGAAGVVFIMNRSQEALAGNYLPFYSGHEPLPAVFVDRDTGNELRRVAAQTPQVRLTVDADITPGPVRSVTAVIPGTSDETVILNTHTDGQGFVEENGAVAFVQLARHFASLPPEQRPSRTLVFACWPGHMAGHELPELKGWMAAHADLVERAAAALTIEHLGCTEWRDSSADGYHATGENEVFGVWTTQGPMFDITRSATITHDLDRTALLRPPLQFGVGAAFQEAGVPQVGAIAGPEYLLNVTDNGDMDKLDERLAAAQIAWVADIVRGTEAYTREELRAGDPTLGSTMPTEDPSTPVFCGPAPLAPDVPDPDSLTLPPGPASPTTSTGGSQAGVSNAHLPDTGVDGKLLGMTAAGLTAVAAGEALRRSAKQSADSPG